MDYWVEKYKWQIPRYQKSRQQMDPAGRLLSQRWSSQYIDDIYAKASEQITYVDDANLITNMLRQGVTLMSESPNPMKILNTWMTFCKKIGLFIDMSKDFKNLTTNDRTINRIRHCDIGFHTVLTHGYLMKHETIYCNWTKQKIHNETGTI